MRETEVFIPADMFEDAEPFASGLKKNVLAFPADWVRGFGSNYYSHAQARELLSFEQDGTWDILREGMPYSESLPLQVTSIDKINNDIMQIINDMKQEANNE